ncbi:MAG: stage III sporulation protein AE [Clostridia bacterium]|nr:stage III sporulation protein AE [Clostridia bacterium]
MRTQKKRGFQRIFIIILAILFSFLLFSGEGRAVAHALTQEEEGALEKLEVEIGELIQSLDTEELQNFLDSLSEFGGISVKDKVLSLITGDFALDYSSVFTATLALVWEEGQAMLPAFAVILAVALLCGILNSVKNSFLQSTTSDIIHFVSYVAVGVVVLACLLGVLEVGFGSIGSMQRQMEIVYPLLLTLMAASGGSVSVGVYRPAVAFMSGGITELFTAVVLPSAVVVIVLAFVGNLTENVRTEKLGELFKGISKWLIGLTLGLFSLFLTVQGIASAQYDGLSLRAARYVLSGSVPIVGGFLSGGVDVVVAGSALIKNAFGAFALYILVGTLLRPLLLYCAFQLFLRISAAATEPVGGKTSSFLSALAKDSGYFLSALLCIAFLYFLTIILLICSTGAFF